MAGALRCFGMGLRMPRSVSDSDVIVTFWGLVAFLVVNDKCGLFICGQSTQELST